MKLIEASSVAGTLASVVLWPMRCGIHYVTRRATYCLLGRRTEAKSAGTKARPAVGPQPDQLDFSSWYVIFSVMEWDNNVDFAKCWYNVPKSSSVHADAVFNLAWMVRDAATRTKTCSLYIMLLIYAFPSQRILRRKVTLTCRFQWYLHV